MRTSPPSFLARLRQSLTNERGEVAADLLVPVSGIKAVVQRGADIVKAMEANRVKLGEPKTTADEAATLRADFATLKALGDTNAEDVAAERVLRDRKRNLQPVVDADAQAAASAAGDARISVTDRAAEEAKQPGFFGRQLQAVQRFAANNGWNHISADDQRVLSSMLDRTNRNKVQAAATGLTSDIASDGGFLVGQDRSNVILQRAYSQGEVLKRVGRLPIGPGSNGMKLPAIDETSRADNSRFGGIVSGWLGQGNSLTAGKPKFREIDLKLRKVGAFVYATDEMLADSIALEGWVNKYLPLELTFRAEDAIVNGTGSNQPLGVRNSGAVISVTRNTSNRILYEDINAMWLRMWAPARTNAVWLVDQSAEGELEQLAIALGTAGVLAPIYKPAGSVPGQQYATLYGRPVIPVEYCAALGTSGDIVLVALDEYTLIDKAPVESAVSIHVAFLTDEQVFRFIYRVDGQLNWNSALTPKSAGSTLSCVVVLST